MTCRTLFIAALLMASLGGLCLLAGCGSSASAAPKLDRTAVSGVVTLDGNPLPGACLKFVPLNKTPGFGGTAVTDDQGRYQASAGDGEAELAIGDYQVLVTLGAPPEDADAPPMPVSASGIKLPAGYGDSGRSPLVIGLQKDAGVADLELRSRP